MAILVVMIHVKPFGNADTSSLLGYLNFGVQNYIARIAVPYFFLIAGFLLYKKMALENVNIHICLRYIKYILRMYLMWSFIYLPLSIQNLRTTTESDDIIHLLIMYLKNMIFVGSYQHLWYLSALGFAILIISVMLWKNIRPHYILVLSALFYLVGLFAQSWYGFIVPLKMYMPQLWVTLEVLGEMIITTRNGLFMGTIYVALGMCLAFGNYRIKASKALFCFIISMCFLLIEVFVLQYGGYIREYDMYLFSVPSTLFLALFTINVDLPNSPIYKLLRNLSSLIYYLHLWVNVVVINFLRVTDESSIGTTMQFALTLLITTGLSLCIIAISNIRQLKWIRRLYS